MNILRTALAEFVGLFVDDGALALWAIVIVALVTVLVEVAGLPPLAGGALLTIGCLAILAESVLRAARRRR